MKSLTNWKWKPERCTSLPRNRRAWFPAWLGPGSAYCGSLLAGYSLHCLAFSRFHVLAQDGIDCGLVAASVLAEECQDIGIEA